MGKGKGAYLLVLLVFLSGGIAFCAHTPAGGSGTRNVTPTICYVTNEPEELFREAQQVFIGEPRGALRCYAEPPHGWIRTDYEITVQETLKGELPERISLSCMGGTVPYSQYLESLKGGESHQEAYEFAVCRPEQALEEGKRYLFFVRRAARGRDCYYPVSSGESSMLLIRESRGKAVVSRNDTGTSVPLEDFLEELRANG